MYYPHLSKYYVSSYKVSLNTPCLRTYIILKDYKYSIYAIMHVLSDIPYPYKTHQMIIFPIFKNPAYQIIARNPKKPILVQFIEKTHC